MHVESIYQFIHGEELTIIAGIPAHQRQIIDQRLGQIALLNEVRIVRVAVTLAQLVVRVARMTVGR